nr:MAG TPA: hypothetical protein [Caudoviricetes sp.]
MYKYQGVLSTYQFHQGPNLKHSRPNLQYHYVSLE